MLMNFKQLIILVLILSAIVFMSCISLIFWLEEPYNIRLVMGGFWSGIIGFSMIMMLIFWAGRSLKK
jgi:hypothetical protein